MLRVDVADGSREADTTGNREGGEFGEGGPLAGRRVKEDEPNNLFT